MSLPLDNWRLRVVHLLSTFMGCLSSLYKGKSPARSKFVDEPFSRDHHEEVEKVVFYEYFLEEIDPEERRHFCRLARECIRDVNYSRGETLYHYCYFSTLKFRMERIKRLLKPLSGVGAYVYSQGIKELEYTVDYYRSVLEKGSLTPCKGSSVSCWMEERVREIYKPVKALKV